MKKIGIVGGVGWPSTIEYYKSICTLSQSYWEKQGHSRPLPTPEIVIESLNMNFTVNNRGSAELGSWNKWDQYFKTALEKLEANGAELLLIASATPHTRLAQISSSVTVPVISIYEAIGKHCQFLGVRNLLVLGTLPTMSSSAFIDGVSKYDLNVFYPSSENSHDRVVGIIDELYHNITDGSLESIDAIVRENLTSANQDNFAVCLGCTELPIAFGTLSVQSDFHVGGITYLNSTVIHSQHVFEACLV